jgi:uncharacterized integral membrane protein
MGYIIVAIVAGVVALFSIQNPDRVTVRMLVWQLGDVPLAVVVLASLGAGLVIAGVPLLLQRWNLRRRIGRLESAQASAAAPPREVPPKDVE